MSLGANNIHAHFKTACLDDMKEIVESYKGSVSRKPPYSGVEKVRNSALSSFNNLGLVCREPLESLESSYKSLEEKCEKEKEEEEEKEKEKAKGEEGLRALASDTGSSNYGSNNRRSSSSQQDRRRNKDRYSGGNIDNQEFSYTLSDRFPERGDGAKGLGGLSEFGDKGGVDKGYKTDEKYKRTREYKTSESGSKGLEGGKSLSGDSTGLGSGKPGGSAGLGSRVVNAPLRAWSSAKNKVKEMGVKADKNIRDYLLKDNPSYLRYENGYVMTEEQKSRMGSEEELTGLSGLPKSLRKKAYGVYNTMVPISDEEFRKRAGFMRHDVDLFEVNDLLFCRFCLTTIAKSREQRDKCGLPGMGKCGDLEAVIKRYNELAEYQLIKPEEKKVIIQQKLEREREKRELANQGLTREEQLRRISNGLDEAEQKAKKVRKSMGMSF